MLTTPRRMRVGLSATAAVLLTVGLSPGVFAAQRPVSHLPNWRDTASAGTETFRTLAAVDRQFVWLGSDDGTVLRTVDGGRSWRDVSPPGAAGLHVRDLHAFDERHAVAMTAGGGSDSRLFVTSNGGSSWRLAYQATDPAAFFDAMVFTDARHGLVMSDPVDGKFQIVSTKDAGRTWSLLPSTGMPSAVPGEFGFADSGTSMTAAGRDVWFGSGGAVARIFHSRDNGRTWDVSATPILTGDTAGIYGLAFRSPKLGLAVGGDFTTPDVTSGVSAISRNGGPWVSPAREPSGVRFAAAWLPSTPDTAVTVGINGSDISYDAGQHWTRFGDEAFNTVGCAADGTCWAAGNVGQVAILQR